MPLTRLDNLISSKTGKYLYVSPDDFNATDALSNRGNSPVTPFKSIQRAFIEIARYSYLPGFDNDRFDQFTIMLMPGIHYIDNRPGLADTSGVDIFGFDQANGAWTDSSIVDISNPDNIFRKFNNTEGGAIIPRGSSLVGYDLRRTTVRPLYVPDPAVTERTIPRSAIFNVTGGCYFWQFTIKDGQTSSESPLWNASEGTGEVYYDPNDFTKLAAPNYSHHKLTVFEYADSEELGLYYRKVAKAFSAYQPTIDDPGEFAPRVQENRIVGPLSDSRIIESLKFTDSTTDASIPASTTEVEVTTKVDHGYFQGQFVAISSTEIDDILEGIFPIKEIDQNDARKFIYEVPSVTAAIGTNITSGKVVDINSTPALGQNAQTLAEVDSVESASPYVFNCSIRSTWGICGIWANGLKATGFKSVVIAQYTGVSLQQDDRAFIRYDEYSNTWNQASLTDAFATIPYHTKGDSYWKDEWRNFHVRASEDSFIQCVSIFAVGYADHFLMESGGDMSITNSNSNFGNTSLHAKGFKGFAFNQDKGGFITDIIPPKQVTDNSANTEKVQYYTVDIAGTIQNPTNYTKLFLGSDDLNDPVNRPAATITGYRLGAKSSEKLYVKLEPSAPGDDGLFNVSLEPTGFVKYIAKGSILNPSGLSVNNAFADAANLIESNRRMMQEEVFGYILQKYPALRNVSYVNPGLDPAANRYADARNLIQANRQEIIDDAWAKTLEYAPSHASSEAKCKRDIGYVVDAISEDLRDGGNANVIAATKTYFNPDGTPLSNGLLGEEEESVYAFQRAKDYCKQAIANLLTVSDDTITMDPANPSVSYTPTSATYNSETGDLTLTVASHGFTGSTTTTATSAAYNGANGLLTLTIPNHGYTNGDKIKIADNSLTFTCDMDGGYSSHTYPRSSDPASGAWLTITGSTTNTVNVNVGAAPTVYFTPSAGSYNATTGDLVLTIGSHTLSTGTYVKIADNSLNFTCSMDDDATVHSYPRLTDPVSGESIQITGTTANSVTLNVGASPLVEYTPTNATYTPTTGIMELTIGNHNIRGAKRYTPTAAAYNPNTGFVTLTIAGHGFQEGEKIRIDDGALTFTCDQDSNGTNHSYPRATDPVSGAWLQISSVTTDTFAVQILASVPSTNTTTHSFVSAAANSITKASDNIKLADGAVTFTCAQDGNATNHSYPRTTTSTATVTGATYAPSTGVLELTVAGHGLNNGEQIKLADDSLTFTCAQDSNGSNHTYPRSSDPISGKWISVFNVQTNTFQVNVGVSSNITTHNFVSAVNNGLTKKTDPFYDNSIVVEEVGTTTTTVTGAAYTASTGVMVITVSGHGLNNGDKVKFAKESLTFTCLKDNGQSNHSYPRTSDPAFDEWLTVANKTTNTFEVNVGISPAHDQYTHTFISATADGLIKQSGTIKINIGVSSNVTAHTFVSAVASSVKTGGSYTHTFVSANTNALITGGNYIHNFISASANGIEKAGDSLSINADALTFTCEQDNNSTQHKYPRASDPVYGKTLPISSTTSNTLTVNVGAKTAKGYDINNSTYNPVTGDLVLTLGSHTINTGTSIRLAKNALTFTCSMDNNGTNHTYPRTGDPAYNTALNVTAVGSTNHTATNATYAPATGELVLTIASHGFSNGDMVKIADGSLTMTCAMDGNASNHTYPRATDPVSGKWLEISAVTADTFKVNIGASPDTSAHTFVSAVSNGVKRQDGTVTVNVGQSPIVNYNVSGATYNPTSGVLVLTIGTHTLTAGTSIKLGNNSLTFTCAQDSNATNHTYPRAGDPAYNTAINIASVTSDSITLNVGTSSNTTTHTFVSAASGAVIAGGNYTHTFVNTSNTHSVTGAVYQPSTGVMTLTVNGHGFVNGEHIKLANNSLTFTCAQDSHNTNHTYPRPTDPSAGKWLKIFNVQANTFDVQVLKTIPSTNTTVHTFVSATANNLERGLVIEGGEYPHTFVSAENNAITIFRGDSSLNASRNKDARNLILANKNSIITEAITAINAYDSNHASTNYETKCRRDLGRIIDAIAQDLWFGGNEYTISYLKTYFSGNALLSNGVQGEVNQVIVGLNKVQDQINLAINNQLSQKDTSITTDTTGEPPIVSDANADVSVLLLANSKFIAKEAYEQMKVVHPSYTPAAGYTEQDCLDDVYDVVRDLSYNMKHGGNHKIYDIGNGFVTNNFNGVPLLMPQSERTEVAEVYKKVKAVVADVITNTTVTPTNWTPDATNQQVKDLTLIGLYDAATCNSMISATDTLMDIIVQGVGTDAAVGNLNSITRTEPTQPTTYTQGNCAEVLSTVDTLVGIFTDSLLAGNLNDLVNVSNGEWDCANVRNTIETLFDILVDSILAGNLNGLPTLNTGDFTINNEQSKCFRDVAYIVDAVVNDLRLGGNINSVQAGEAYFVNAQLDFVDGQASETIDAWNYVGNMCTAAMRNFDFLAYNCTTTAGSSTVDVGDTSGIVIGMSVVEYDESGVSPYEQGVLKAAGTTPLYTTIPEGTYVKKIISNTTIELGVNGSRLETGNKVNAILSSSSINLYFTYAGGAWADTAPLTKVIGPVSDADRDITRDSTTNSSNAECAATAAAINTLIGNITTIISSGLGSVTRQEQTVNTSLLASRSTVFTIDTTGAGSTNAHDFETGTPVRLVPRPRFDSVTGKYVSVDKRVVRLPNGFEPNVTYYVIAPGRTTQPIDYSGTTYFNGSDQTKLMLATSKENAAAGIYIYSSETTSVDPDVEIDIYQFVLDDRYDLHSYRTNLATAASFSGNGGFETEIPNIVDKPSNSTTAQQVFFRAEDGSQLPLVSTAFANNANVAVTDNSSPDYGRLNPNVSFYVRYQNDKVFTIHLSKADALNDVRVTFDPGQTGIKFTTYANKSRSPMAFDPTFTDAVTTSGKWYIKCKDEVTGSPAGYDDNIFWRINQPDLQATPRSTDMWFERLKDDRTADDRTYKIRYVIPKDIENARDPINGFVIKGRTDDTRKLIPQKLVLKPVTGSVYGARFKNPRQQNEYIGYTAADFTSNSLSVAAKYDPYKKDLTNAGIDYRAFVTTASGLKATIQSGRYVEDPLDPTIKYLELNVFDHAIDIVNYPGLKNETFTTVRIDAPQGGDFVTNKTQSITTNQIQWTGNSSGIANVHAYYNVGSNHYLILKNIRGGKLEYSEFVSTRFTQGTIFADMVEDQDFGKSLPLKTLIAKGYPEYYYKQAGANVYTITPGDRITDDAGIEYYVDTVNDVGIIEDTFYIFNVETLQKRIFGQQEGIFYLTCLRGNIQPFPTGPGVVNNFKEFRFSQPVSKLYPLNYRNDPLWFQKSGTTSEEKNVYAGLIDPPQAYSAADNYTHGLVTVNDYKGSVTRELVEDWVKQPAFIENTYTVQAQSGNATSGSEDRRIKIAGTSTVMTDDKFYVEFRRPSIARAGNHTFEYLGFGPGNYSTGLPVRQEIVLTPLEDFYAQSKKQNGGIVFYTGLNSNGDLYIGNKKINAITGEETFLDAATLNDDGDPDDVVGGLVTTFDTAVTFNQNITVVGGNGSLVNTFESPVLISVQDADLTQNRDALIIRSNVSSVDPVTLLEQDESLDRNSFTPAQGGDIRLSKNRVDAAVFGFNSRGNGQEYMFQTHTNSGGVPTNMTPNQTSLVANSGTRINTNQFITYGGVQPKSGDVLLKGDEIGESGSLGWIYANYFSEISVNSIFTITFDGSNVVKLTFEASNVAVENQALGITSSSKIRFTNYPVSLLNLPQGWPVYSPSGDAFSPTNNYVHFQVTTAQAQATLNWATIVAGNNPDPKIFVSTSEFKELGVIGADAIRTYVRNTLVSGAGSIGDYRLGVNTVARASHSSYETGFVDTYTNPKANLDVVGSAFISGTTTPDFLTNAEFAARTKNGRADALLVGGDADNPLNQSTLRVKTSNTVGTGQVGINATDANLSSYGLFVNGTSKFTGNALFDLDVQIDGGDLTTAATTFNLVNGTATTVNIAGAATALTIADTTTAAQTIDIGDSVTGQQTIKIGSASVDSNIFLGAIADTATNISKIEIGGAYGNNESLSYVKFGNRKVSYAGDATFGADKILGGDRTQPEQIVTLNTEAGIVSLFSGNTQTIDVATNSSEVNIAGQGGTTTVRNNLEVDGTATFNGSVNLCGGTSAFSFVGDRAQLGSTPFAHASGIISVGTYNKNIDIINVLEVIEADPNYNRLDTAGSGVWGGTTFQNVIAAAGPGGADLPALTGNQYYLPLLNNPGSYFGEGDYIILDTTVDAGTGTHPEIVRVASGGLSGVQQAPYYLTVERQPLGTFTTVKTNHPDTVTNRTPIYKCNIAFDATWTEQTIDSTGTQENIYLASFGGTLTVQRDYVIVDREDTNTDGTFNQGEVFKLATPLTQNNKKLQIKDGCPGNVLFEVDTVTGGVIVGNDGVDGENGKLTVNGSFNFIGGCKTGYKATAASLGVFTGDIAASFTTITNVVDTTGLEVNDYVQLVSGGNAVTLTQNQFVTDGGITRQVDPQIVSIVGSTVTLNTAFSGAGTATGVSLKAAKNEKFSITDRVRDIFTIDACSGDTVIGNPSGRVYTQRSKFGTSVSSHSVGATVYTVLKDPKVDNGIATTFVDTVTPITTTATQLTVDNVSNFAINDFILVGYGSGTQEEFMQITGTPVVTSGTAGYLPVTRINNVANWPGAAKTHADGETVWRVLLRETTVLEEDIAGSGSSLVEIKLKNSDVVPFFKDREYFLFIGDEIFEVGNSVTTTGGTPLVKKDFHHGRLTVYDDVKFIGSSFDIMGSDNNVPILTLVNNDEHHFEAGKLVVNAATDISGFLRVFPSKCVEDPDAIQFSNTAFSPTFRVEPEYGDTFVGRFLDINGIAATTASNTQKIFTVRNLGDGGTKNYQINQDCSIDGFGYTGWKNKNGGHKSTFVNATGSVTSNINYIVAVAPATGAMVLTLPSLAETGDIIRFTEVGGQLTYNNSLVIRAPIVGGEPVAIQGDTEGTKLGGLSTPYGSGELVVQNRNASFGLIFVGQSDGDNFIPAAYQGWWLTEL